MAMRGTRRAVHRRVRRLPSIAVALVVDIVFTRRAWCETAARTPTTVVAALVTGEPTNEAVEAAAQDIATTLRIDRVRQSQRWQLDVRDDYAAPPANEL